MYGLEHLSGVGGAAAAVGSLRLVLWLLQIDGLKTPSAPIQILAQLRQVKPKYSSNGPGQVITSIIG